jgi:hypothetical protein
MRKTYVFPDGRSAVVIKRSVEQSDKIRELLCIGVSRKWIAYHLGIEQVKVDRVCAQWKRNRQEVFRDWNLRNFSVH